MASRIENGKSYVFFNWAQLSVMDLDGSHTADRTKIINYGAHLGENQIWIARDSQDGTFYLVNDRTGTYMDLNDLARDGIIQGLKANESDAQKWKFELASQSGETPSFFVTNKITKQAVTIPGGAAKPTQLKCLTVGEGQAANYSRWIAVPYAI